MYKNKTKGSILTLPVLLVPVLYVSVTCAHASALRDRTHE